MTKNIWLNGCIDSDAEVSFYIFTDWFCSAGDWPLVELFGHLSGRRVKVSFIITRCNLWRCTSAFTLPCRATAAPPTDTKIRTLPGFSVMAYSTVFS